MARQVAVCTNLLPGINILALKEPDLGISLYHYVLWRAGEIFDIESLCLTKTKSSHTERTFDSR